MTHPIQWKKYYPLSDKNAFICLVDHMGDDSSIVQAARVSFDGDVKQVYDEDGNFVGFEMNSTKKPKNVKQAVDAFDKDRQLIRYLMNHSHTTPFEMVEIEFMVQVPMDCWRQWIRHRTASVNEYSTRYTEALDFCQVTQPDEWRLQSTDNKQGSSGFLTEWPEGYAPEPEDEDLYTLPGEYLSDREEEFHRIAKQHYKERLAFGIAKEQARKDLPLSTYTRAYWKCDLHNIFNFLRLRMDSHAQLEIRSFANCMFEIVKQICPVACEAFEDYVLHAKKFSRMEMEVLEEMLDIVRNHYQSYNQPLVDDGSGRLAAYGKPASMTDREWKEFLQKLN